MKQRFYSLDVFRGVTVALMILVNNPGSWSHIYAPLAHAEWHGLTPTDLVFPFFLFAVGNAMAIVMPRLRSEGDKAFRKKTLKRFLMIFGIGLLLNWYPFVRYDSQGCLVWKSFENLRIMGVLQRIALCYLLAALITYHLKPRIALVLSVFLLLAYWALCLTLGQSGDPYSLEGFFGKDIDRRLLGKDHLYRGEGVPFDPEGIASTLTATVQVVLGYLFGVHLIRKGSRWETLADLFVASMVLVFLGYCWHMAFPINKKIWSSSYVLYTTGLAVCLLGMLIYATELKDLRGAWSRFFLVFGKNPLFIFVLSGVWVKTYALFRIFNGFRDGKPVFRGLGSWMYDIFFSPVFGPINGSLVYAVAHLLAFWTVGLWLDRKRIYIRV